MDFIQDWGLTAMVFAPLAGVAIMMLFPKDADDTHKVLALLTSLVTAAIGIAVLADFDYDRTGTLQFVRDNDWISVINARYLVGIDGLSVPLIALTLLITPLVIAYSWNHFPEPHNPKAFLSLILVLHTGMLGTFVAQDLILFFVFFEVVLLPMYFMIGVWGGPERQYASIKFFLYTLFGSALMILSFLALFFLTGAETFSMVELAERVQGLDIARTTQILVFGGMFMGFGIKVPMFPFHTWLPDAHTQAPTAGSVILAGVMLKLGTYGFVRFGLYLFPDASLFFAPVIATLGVIGILYGAVVATMQKDIKRLVAYSSVAHLGFIALGTFAMTTQGIGGGVLQMVNHGISTGALFLLLGMLYERRHTYDIAAMSGLQKAAPVLAGVFTLVMLSSIGLPGLNGFVGEFLILAGAYLTLKWWAVVAAAGVILAALYLLWAYQRVFHGEPTEEDLATPDMRVGELAYMAPLLALIVFLGIYPKPVLERIEPSVAALVEHIEGATDFEEPDAATSGFSGELVDSHAEGSDDHGEGE